MLLALCAAAQVTAADRTELPDKLTLVALLSAGKFTELAARLKHYQDGYVAGSLAEAGVEAGFLAFANSEPALENRLAEWVSLSPESYLAHGSRGVYYWNLGVLARASTSVPDHDAGDLSDQQRYFDRAAHALGVAVTLNPRFSVGLSLLIDLVARLGDANDLDAVIQHATSSVSGSQLVHRRALEALRPDPADQQTPGELDAMQNYVSTHIQGDTRFATLLGFTAMVQADRLARDDERVRAASYYDAALMQGEYWLYRVRRALNYFKNQRFEAALSDINKALVLRPQSPRSLSLRARILVGMQQYDAAFDDWDLALQLNPYDPIILLHYAFALRDQQRFEDAMRALTKALELGSDNVHVWDARGRILLYDYQLFDLAVEALAYPVASDPASPRYRFNYAAALYKNKSCDAVEQFMHYRSLCASGQCPQTNLDWIDHSEEILYASGRCQRRDAEGNIVPRKRRSHEK